MKIRIPDVSLLNTLCLILTIGLSQSLFAQHITINSVSPSRYEHGVPADANIVLEFDDTIDGTTLNENTVVVRGEYSGNRSWTATGQGTSTITFNLDQDFDIGELIVVTITTGVASNDGDTLAHPYSFSFVAETSLSPANFEKQVVMETSNTAPMYLFPIDLDNDGDMDFTATLVHTSSDKIVWYENDGMENFTEHEVADDIAFNTYYRSLRAADIDKDGDVDLAAVAQNKESLYWYENDGNQNFTPRLITDTLDTPVDINLADMDGDGHLDLVVVGLFSDLIIWYEHDGAADPSFTGHNIAALEEPYKAHVVDVDGDGDLDVLVNSFEERIDWYENDGNQNFTHQDIDSSASGLFHDFQTADIDGDGDVDIIQVVSSGFNWWENDGASDPEFTKHAIASSLSSSNKMSLEDIDGDGDVDIFMSSKTEDTIVWFENDAAGNFTEHLVSTEAEAVTFLNTADVNGDGFIDLLVLSMNNDYIHWYENTFNIYSRGRSVSLNGIDQFLNLNAVNAQFNNRVDFTVEFWMKGDKNDQPGNAQATLFGLHTSSGNNKFMLFMGQGSDQDGYAHLFYGGFEENGGIIPIGDNKWHHIAVIQNVNDSISVYVDGRFDGSRTTIGVSLSPTDQWSIGQEYDADLDTDHFKGLIDEVRIWKTVRSPEEIRQYMFQTVDKDDPDLAGYWQLDETNNRVANESTSNQAHAILAGFAEHNEETHPKGTFITGEQGWRLMASPVANVSYATLLEPIWTQGFTGADAESDSANVFTWNEPTQRFQAVTNGEAIPDSGAGFLVYIYDDHNFDGTPDGFPKAIRIDSAQYTESITPTLSYTESGAEDSVGWNLIGNPYGETIKWGAPSGWTRTNLDDSFYIWNEEAGEYQSHNGTTGTLAIDLIAPMQGFWVKASANNPSLTLTKEVQSVGGVFYKKAIVPQLRFTLTDGARSSSSVIMFSESASLDKDPLDAYKLRSLKPDYLSLFTQLKDGAGLDINAIPLVLEETLSINLNYTASKVGGTYTLHWDAQYLPEEMSVMLTDNQTGTQINLKEKESYEFEAAINVQKCSSAPTPTPFHTVIAPKVIKAKRGGFNSRFTLTLGSEPL